MMFWSDHDAGVWGYTGMAVGMIVFCTLVIIGIVALIRWSSATFRTRAVPQPQSDRESPEQVLAIRFAHGDIDEAEYQHRLGVLRGALRH